MWSCLHADFEIDHHDHNIAFPSLPSSHITCTMRLLLRVFTNFEEKGHRAGPDSEVSTNGFGKYGIEGLVVTGG
jgi:hypothetical protein